MLLERLQEQILNTIGEMLDIQVYVYGETNLDRREDANDAWFEKRNILRLLLSIQIADREERETVLDYICDGIERKAWRNYVNFVETRG